MGVLTDATERERERGGYLPASLKHIKLRYFDIQFPRHSILANIDVEGGKYQRIAG